MESDYDATNNIQAEISSYACISPEGSDAEISENDDLDFDDDSFNVDLGESDVDQEDVTELGNDAFETLKQFTEQIEDDLENSILNELSTTHLNLTVEQRGVLQRCQNPTLKRLLLLNRLKAMHCLEFIKKIDKSKHICSNMIQSIKFKDLHLSNKFKKAEEMRVSNIWRLGFPYFKTEKYISPQYNEDYNKKVANNELVHTSFSDGRRWIYDDQVALYDIICEGYLQYRQKMVQQQLNYVKSAHEICQESQQDCKIIESQIKKLTEELEAIQNETEYIAPPLNDESGIDWLKTIGKLQNIHSATECQAFWRIYLHPDINKKDWTKEENVKIHHLVEKYKFQNWDAIAKELNTNRTGFMVIVHYFGNLCDKFKRDRFTPDEDEKLMNLVEEHRLGNMVPWTAIATSFGGERSKHQLYHRFTYYLEPGEVKKGSFTEAEDILLTYMVRQFGKSFTTIAKLIKHRTPIQLRNRYSNYLEKLNPELSTFTAEDDQKIIKFVSENGESSWSQLAEQLNKGRMHLRQRYRTIKKYLNMNPNMSLDLLPRKKKTTFLRNHNERAVTMEIVLENIKIKMNGPPTLKTVEQYLKKYKLELNEKSLKVCRTYKKREISEADKKLISFFKTICRVQRREVVKPDEAIADSANRITKLLTLLGSNSTNIFESINLLDYQPNSSDYDVMVKIKDSYLKKKSNFAGSSSVSFLNSCTIKEILPPTVCTLVGVRGLVIKYDEFRTTHELFISDIKNSNLKSYTLENLSTELDNTVKQKILNERMLFLSRLVAIFKWPTILSRIYPNKELLNYDQQERVVEVQPPEDEVIPVPKRIGRPKKKPNDKVNKMIEARRKKRSVNAIEIEEEEVDQPVAKIAKMEEFVRYYPSRMKASSAYIKKSERKKCTSILDEQSTSQSS